MKKFRFRTTLFAVTLALISAVLFSCGEMLYFNHQNIELSPYAPVVIIHSEETDPPPINQAVLADLELHSTTAFLINATTNQVLLDNYANQRMYPASMVKMMTALVAIENLGDLSQNIFFSPAIFPPLREIGASTAGFFANEIVPAYDVLPGILLPSGADATVAIAQHISGSEAGFVVLMNQKAQALGMYNTNFENTSGLPHENQYTTASDMAILLYNGLQNEIFRDIITRSTHTAQPTNRRTTQLNMRSTLFSRMSSPYFGSSAILGGRTGFTFEAGQTLASFTEIYDEIYILVTMGAYPPSSSRHTWHIDDAFVVYRTLYELLR